MIGYQDDQHKYSNHHYGFGYAFDDLVGDISPPRETIRSIVEYRDFLIKLTSPNEGHLWYVTDKNGKAIPEIDGKFTKVQLAYDAINRYLDDIQKRKEELDNRNYETKRQSESQTLQE